jgi:imidazole glycerol-phosphate synthase subunit HisH
MIAIVDYGMGNLLSVKNALDYLGEDNFICSIPTELIKADKIILPGIGGFPDCIKTLEDTGFVSELNDLVLNKKIPILGICLGMQVMCKYGYEFEKVKGLGWFDAEVVNINTVNDKIKIPNVGWEEVVYNKKSPLFKKLPKKPDFYLVHSFFMKFEDENSDEIDAYYEVDDTKITAAIRKNNIFATQFHPEKSSDLGMTVLENFIDWEPIS